MTALERTARALPGRRARRCCSRSQTPIETVLAGVLNELSVLPDEVDLVLDDYHLRDEPEIVAPA